MLATLLRERGHDAVHIRELGPANVPDTTVVTEAIRSKRLIVSRDLDFGMLLAESNATEPSFVSLRRRGLNRPEHQLAVIEHVLDQHSDDLRRGAIVVVDNHRIRVRRLPLSKR